MRIGLIGFVTVVGFSLFASCGKLGLNQNDREPEKEIIRIPDLDDYMNVSSAPAQLQSVSSAVVRVAQFGGPMATAFFIDRQGILMTNYHVLGDDGCFVSGCVAELDFNYQSDKKYAKPVTVFAKPLRLSPAFDMVVYRIYKFENGKIGEVLKVDNAIKINKKTAQELLGQNVHVMGHPDAKIKKVKTAKAYKIQYKYVVLNKYVLGGNSGSPVLDQNGELVGILHSGHDSTKTISKDGIIGTSNISASADIVEQLGLTGDISKLEASDLGKSLSEAPTYKSSETISSYKAEQFFNAGGLGENVSAGDIAKFKQDINMAFLKECKEVVAQEFTRSQNSAQLGSLLGRCIGVANWVACDKEGSRMDMKFCPETKPEWKELFVKLSKRLASLDGFKFAVYPALIYRTMTPGENSEALSMLNDMIAENDPTLIPDIAYAKAVLGKQDKDFTFKNTSLAAYVLNYRAADQYYFEFEKIGKTAIQLYLKNQISKGQLQEMMGWIFADPKITLEAKLDLESELFEADLIK